MKNGTAGGCGPDGIKEALMKKEIQREFSWFALLGVGMALFLALTRPAAGIADPGRLAAEEKVRFSNDPRKTEMFRDAGLGFSSTGARTPRWEPRSPGPSSMRRTIS